MGLLSGAPSLFINSLTSITIQSCFSGRAISIPLKSFNDCYSRIEPVVEKWRAKWFFKASIIKDFDDVKTEILTHIYKKWDLYDQSRPVENWAAQITHNKFTNELRDSYMGTASPCNACKFNEGSKLCVKFGKTENMECNFFHEWYYKKRYKHEARMPYSSDDPNHPTSVSEMPNESVDVEPDIPIFHERIKPRLTDSEWRIYKCIYIDNLSDEETADILDLKSNEAGKTKGYKRIREVKKILVKKGREMIMKEGVRI